MFLPFSRSFCKCNLATVVCVTLISALPWSACGGDGSNATLKTSAGVTIRTLPQRLRIQMMIADYDKSIADAQGAHRMRKERIRDRLIRLGCDKERITFGEEFDGTELLSGGSGVVGLAPTPATLVEVPRNEPNVSGYRILASEMYATVDLKSGGGHVQQVAEMESSLQEQDLTGVQKLAEIGVCRSCNLSSSLPRVMFVSLLSDEQLEAAEKSAFANAKSAAERMARACGHRLGDLTEVEFSLESFGEHEAADLTAVGWNAEALISERFVPIDQAGIRMSQSKEPGHLAFRVAATVRFSVLKANHE